MELPVDYRKLTPQERKAVREEYVRLQKGLCCYCNAPLSGPPAKRVTSLVVNESLFPEGFFDWPVHLHHYHDTGWTIGAVHCRCNAVSWQYEGV